MEIKAALKVRLYANEELVAESDDHTLWHSVLQTAQRAAQPKLLVHYKNDSGQASAQITTQNESVQTYSPAGAVGADEALQRFAQSVGIRAEEIEGACYPTHEEPYLHIDQHYWAAFKSNTGKTGRGAIGPAVLAATLLVRWFKYAGLGDVERQMVINALKELGITDKNIDRGLAKCAWLSKHGTIIKLNPSAINQADALVKGFCTKQSVVGI